MTLCIDIGNTRIHCACGVAGKYEIANIETELINTADEFIGFLSEAYGKVVLPKISGCVISCVVQCKKTIVADAVSGLKPNIEIKLIDKMMLSVDFTMYNGLLGEDRAVCVNAAVKKCGSPLVVIDFGTATTINVVDEKTKFIGGAILAGIQTGMDALANATSQLPMIDLSKISGAEVCGDIKLIGSNTNECLVSGAVMSAAFAAEGYIRQITKQFSVIPKVVITGGNAAKVIPYCDFDYIYEPNLLIEGLFELCN